MTVQFAALNTDGYKTFHKDAYGEGITEVYGNKTARNGRLSNIPPYLSEGKVVNLGIQFFIKEELINTWDKTFFQLPKEAAVGYIKRHLDAYLGKDYDTSHFEQLHDLGYLPIQIKALPEGVLVPYGVPSVTIKNTAPEFAWLTNYLETIMSTYLWPIQTSATTARMYMKNIKESFERTGGDLSMLPFMCHDFSMRGMFGPQAASMSGFAHLAVGHAGTDCIPAIIFAEQYYGADVENEMVGVSVPATEHSTTTSYIMGMCEKKGITKFEAELEYVRYLFTKVPTGILSHVSDSFDFWKFVSEGIPQLKEDILNRDGTFVIRPDSGDPVDILCGRNSQFGEGDSPEEKGLVESLWDIFGGTETEQGYKLLDSHIGAIYGDSITLERQDEIIQRLEAKGFVPNVVLGVGSFSYQHVTRDTHGSAIKATSVVWDGEQVDVCKDPATDSKKKSAKGLLRVELENGEYVLHDQQTPEQEYEGELQIVFKDGMIRNTTTLNEIRQRIEETL